jgi:2-polyprenyl-3-methyl-5-hydroxy-6-metoxy-1,4-benzoquinol methylase
MTNEFVEKRKKGIKKSLFDPDYIFEREIKLFLCNNLANSKNAVVLDYGAGNSPYKNIFVCEKYISADINQNNEGSIDYIINENGAIELADDSVDVVICLDVLEHVYNSDSVVNELYRVLKVDGVLLVSIPFIYREHEMPNDYYRYTSSCIKKYLKLSFFNDIKLMKIGNAWFTIYSLFNEKHILQGERVKNIGVIKKALKKIFNCLFLPLFNLTLFSKRPDKDDPVYHHLFVSCKK